MMNIKEIIKNWLGDKPANDSGVRYFSESDFECLHDGNKLVLGWLHFPKVYIKSCYGLLIKFESSVFRRNIARVVLIQLPQHRGKSVTQICEGIAQYVHNNLLAHYPASNIMWYEHYVSDRSMKVDKICFNVQSVGGIYHYEDPNWKKDDDGDFLNEIVTMISKVFDVEYDERHKVFSVMSK